MPGLEFVQGDAACDCDFAFALCQKQPARRRRIVTRQLREFFIEVLEAQAEAKRLRVLQK